MTPDEHRERAEADMLAVAPEPEDTCQPVEVDGEIIRVRGFGELTERDRAFAAEIVRAAKRKFDAGPIGVRLRQEIAGVLREAPGRWNIRARTDAVMAALGRFLDIGDADAWCKTCRRVWDGPDHRCESDAEQRLAAVREKAVEWSALAPADDWGDTPQDTALADTGRYLISLIDKAAEQPRTTANNPATSKDPV